VADLAGLHGLHDLVGDGEHCAVAEAGGDLCAAVYAGERLVLVIAAQLQSLFDDGGEVLVLADVNNIGEGHHVGGEYSVLIGGSGGHEAVGGVENWGGNAVKFLLLVLPGGAEVALQLGIFLQLGIGVGRQHFAVGVDVDALSGGLLQQQLQILQVVAGDHDERAFFHGERHGSGNGSAVGLGVGLVQQGHALKVYLAGLHYHGQKRVHGVLAAYGGEGAVEEIVDGAVGVAQRHGVPGVGGHAAQTEEYEGLKGTDVLVGGPYLLHVVVLASGAGIGAHGTAGNQTVALGVDAVDHLIDGLVVEVDVGDGGEETRQHGSVSLGGGGLAAAVH